MIDDVWYIVAGAFVMGLGLLIASLAAGYLGQVSDALPLRAADNATMSAVWTRFPAAFDNAFGLGVIGVMGASLALLYFVNVTPALFFLVVITEALVLIVSGILANAWETVAGPGALLEATASTMVKTDFILSNWLVFVAAYFILATVVFFAKPGGEVPQ